MAAFNRVLIILIAIMAIGAAYMSYLLFEKRNDFRDRAADLADTVKVAVSHLDENSNTRVGKNITFSQATEELPESGTLSWSAYENRSQYNDNLEAVEKLAEDINTQRDYLAEQLRAVALELGLPSDELSLDDLTNAADSEIYQNAAEKVMRLAVAEAERSEELIQTIVNSANVIEVSIDENNLTEREVSTDADGNEIFGSYRHERPLDKYSTAVNDLNTRCFNYGNTLAKAITQISAFDWNTTPERIQDRDNYSPALTTLANDFDRINDLMVSNEELQAKIGTLEEDLKEAQLENDRLNDIRNELEGQVQELKSYKEKYETIAGKKGTLLGEKMKGEILMVNDQWNFVILNLGEDQVYSKAQLLVSRDKEFIARLEVTSVEQDISVAEVMPDTQQAPIRKGDLVIAPATQKVTPEDL